MKTEKLKKLNNTAHVQQKGFSLIELMVVIVIVGILGSIAVPAYKDYVIRAKVTEFFTIAQPIKLAVTEALMAGKASASITSETLGLADNQYSENIQNITVANGIITITANNETLGLPAEQALAVDLAPTQTPQGLINWGCSTGAGTQKYVPANCRH